MPLNLPFEIIIEIIHQLDYTCFPKILHVNREIRSWILDNWVTILKRRPLKWREHIPKDDLKRINETFVNMPSKWKSSRWTIIQSLPIVTAVLLRGADIDYPNKDGMNCFFLCTFHGFLEIADVRKFIWADRSC